MRTVRESVRLAASRADLVPCAGHMIPREAARQINERYARAIDAIQEKHALRMAEIKRRAGAR
ncbi:hypothetical protein SAMN05443247_07618 [Bradyrhizobium erythrophlei]|nr:hypothetical protein SAMN05443247_07618 [Bradyrhizobium erythrophlei]